MEAVVPTLGRPLASSISRTSFGGLGATDVDSKKLGERWDATSSAQTRKILHTKLASMIHD